MPNILALTITIIIICRYAHKREREREREREILSKIKNLIILSLIELKR
jgi:hypothetical protein